jgi:hypothetical protein
MVEQPLINAQRLFPIFQSVGYAVLQAQTVEDALGIHLALVYDLKPGVARAEAEAVFSAYSGRTLGQLLNTARQKATFPPELVTNLDAFKVDRNWLVHRSRPDQRIATKSDVSTNEFCERVSTIGHRAADLQQRIQQVTEEHLVSTGYARSDRGTGTAHLRRVVRRVTRRSWQRVAGSGECETRAINPGQLTTWTRCSAVALHARPSR